MITDDDFARRLEEAIAAGPVTAPRLGLLDHLRELVDRDLRSAAGQIASALHREHPWPAQLLASYSEGLIDADDVTRLWHGPGDGRT